ncbi:MAG: magnesium-translocating P-type ATPase [Ilumatobacteraceae bacterium]
MGSRRSSDSERSPSPRRFWIEDVDDLISSLRSDPSGLSSVEAGERLRLHGKNSVELRRSHHGLQVLLNQFTSPIILMLVAATVLSIALGDLIDGLIILVIISISGLLGYWQERSAGQAVDSLLSRVQVHAEVLRDGVEIELPVEDLVVGDIVMLRAGDLIPADGRVLVSRSLLVDESVLTGESLPTEKTRVDRGSSVTDRSSAVFAGTHVASGTGTLLVVATGATTEFGALSRELDGQSVTTRFERGITEFGMLLVKAMVVLATGIFAVNLVLGRSMVDSLMFSLALAVGLTPQMLPAIVSISLSSGARRMAAERVIVKRLDAIEDFGTMTVLCTDKTGTLTVGAARLDATVGATGEHSDEVLRLARLNSALQQGFVNPLDSAILADASTEERSEWSAVRVLGEVPYDFERKRLSIHISGSPSLIITKGAVRQILEVCAWVDVDQRVVPMSDVRTDVESQFATLSAQGFRVLALATRQFPEANELTVDDEIEMTLRGLLCFADPPKPGTPEAIAALAALGVSVRLVTGDNRLAARHIAELVGLDVAEIVTGDAIESLSDDELARRVADVHVFAEVEPLHKERIVRALQASGRTVGFLGDGINDAAALQQSDVGISVESAVDVAKHTAAVVLLDKSLDVVAEGLKLGRRTFANTMKYVRVTTSANFGNMLSLAAAAAFLPFLPLLPRQILLLNLLSDIPGTTIAGDEVDDEELRRPLDWDIRGVRRFMIVFGLISSIFDIATFVILRWAFGAEADLFRSGWFIESTATELVILVVMRTWRPFWRSRPGRPLLLASAATALATLLVPYSVLAVGLGLVGPPVRLLLVLAFLTAVYVGVNELAKVWWLRVFLRSRRA